MAEGVWKGAAVEGGRGVSGGDKTKEGEEEQRS